MTVAAATSAGYGPKSTEISEITRDGGKTPDLNTTLFEQSQNNVKLLLPNFEYLKLVKEKKIRGIIVLEFNM
jgi:hypothetical protein